MSDVDVLLCAILALAVIYLLALVISKYIRAALACGP
jgi:hypothetical protein